MKLIEIRYLNDKNQEQIYETLDFNTIDESISYLQETYGPLNIIKATEIIDFEAPDVKIITVSTNE